METRLSKSEHWSNTITFKMVVIAAMVLLLLIPLAMIKNIISERESTSHEVENEISSQWGNAQTLAGPVLNIPTIARSVDKKGEVHIERSMLHIMPTNLTYTTSLSPEIRYLGIYKAAVYNSESTITGDFSLEIKPEDSHGKPDWSKAFITFGVSDNRGIRGNVDILWNNQAITPQSGMLTNDITTTGFGAEAIANPELLKKGIPFKIQLQLSGSNSFSILPLGQTSRINMESSWNDPRFNGNLLPQKRQIDESGFQAEWELTHLNRNFPQFWEGKKFNVGEHKLGVNLFLPVNHYQKSLRSAKYGILFISLTMLVFLFIELTKDKKIPVFQYLLAGLAMILFFSLLTALSEHLGFNIAYLIASVANVSLLTLFAYGLLQDKKTTLWVTLLLIAMYAFLFVLLQLNDYAFLAGNIGLVIILSVIMKASLTLSKKK
ncbi:cell envelope integrity protein CreD [Geofilum sp. OHC36d9]|uniref:cell envelope integrity protein CreD n=1 Tax=Geofilum sp. OHC36d9 TaxID=3458413 RepID=UPI00403337D4